MTQSTTQSYPPKPSIRSLWLGLLAGPIVWSLYFIGGYALSEAACYLGFLDGTLLGFNALTTILLLLTTVAFVAIVGIGWLDYQNWRRLRSRRYKEVTVGQIDDYGSFMAVVGLMLSGLSALLTLVIGLAVPFLPMCG